MIKENKIIRKILISLIIIFALMIIKSISSNAFTMGTLDINGGQGITSYPQTYLFGEYYCVDHSLHLARTEDGTKNTSPIVHYNRNYAAYYNEEITYSYNTTFDVEQSIAAGHLAYEAGAGSNVQFQNVVWASGMWSGKPGYVNNLSTYTGTTISGTGSALYERAQGWANFYYNILQVSGMKLMIDIQPTSEDDLRVYVDQNNRTYTEGPYMINIVDASGNILTNNSTEHYDGGTLGNLVYNEILGLNAGCSYFQFIKMSNSNAEVTYTDNNTETFSDITILDAGGNVIEFPKFGEIFYIRIDVPTGNTNTISQIVPHFEIKYYTKLTGASQMYKASKLVYELNLDKSCEYTDAKFNTAQDNDRLTTFYTNKTIYDLASMGVKTEEQLRQYLINLVLNSPYVTGMYSLPGFTALFADDGTNFNDVDKYYQTMKDRYQARERGKISQSTTPETKPDGTIEQKPIYHYNGGDYSSQTDAENAANSKGASDAQEHCDNFLKSNKWIFSWKNHLPIVIETGSQVAGVVQPVIIVNASLPPVDLDTPEPTPVPPGEYEIYPNVGVTSLYLMTTDCTVELGGKVWVDVGATKESTLNGRLNSGGADTGDHMYGGMLVDLHLGDKDGKIVASTTTDSNGGYHFDKLNALEKYTVVFTYNGQLYQQTYYKDDLSGGFSNAQEIDRSGFNDRFDKIDSYPNSYNLNGWHIAYGKNVKLKNDNGDYISGGSSGVLTYLDAWNQFVNYAMNDKSYNNAYNDLSNWLSSNGVGSTDRNGVVQFIKDCMISANTRKYPVYEQFVIENIENPASQPETETAAGQTWNSLYITKSDQSRNVDFGINERDTADLALQKDVYKATVRVNGKTQTYMYNKKDADIDDDGNWNITVRQADYLYNGEYRYTREIRKSEYLYDGTIYNVGQNASARDLQVYVTYRIVVRNQSQTYDTVVNEIVDYFDSSEYTFDGVLNGNTYTPNSYTDFENSNVTSYIGDREGNFVSDLTVKTESSLGNGRGNTDIGHDYTTTPLYLSGIIQPDKSDRLLAGGGMTYIYLTFKVNTHKDENGMDNRVQMDVNVQTGEEGIGKRNIAEINGYSTYYKSGYTVPESLNSDNSIKNSDVGGSIGGSIDIDSTPGNLSSQDLNSDGDLIITDNELTNRTEDDTDKAPNIKLVFPKDDSYERVAEGYVYEDERNTESDKAMVGNGVYDDGDTLIDGVTVQLVELVQEVDANGIPTGNYLGEYVWNAIRWNSTAWEDVNSNMNATEGSLRYYSGQGQFDNTVAPIISGAGITEIPGYTFTDNAKGKYAFKAVPAGDFIIRFIYGDTTQTVLTTTDGEGSEVAALLNGASDEALLGTSGLNSKSYNGQDYKSTTYQTGVDQSGSYNGINGYVDYDKQNYDLANDVIPSYGYNTNGTNKEVNYYYDIAKSEEKNAISDAKDVGNIRTKVNTYSKGLNDIDSEEGQTLLNGRAEVLASGLKVGSSKTQQEQISMLKELMQNTAMVAQTGVINTEIEHNTKHTDNQGDDNSTDYVLKDIDLGLSERPVAQLKMNKEVSNVRITLQNGTIMFDTNRSVTNMPFAQHSGHKITYNPEDYIGKAYRLAKVEIANNKVSTPELITTYMDEELMDGATIEVDYTYTVTNVGEVDYLDNQFYYTGKTANTGADNISTTTANTVIDYISNNIQFLPTSESNKSWSIRRVEDLSKVDNATDKVGDNPNLINSKYIDTMNTYNNIVTNKSMGDEGLYPEAAEVSEGNSSISTTMKLSTKLTPDSGEDTMVYNNLCEIVQTSNTQGRRLKYSIPGNQPMANQESGSDVPADEDNGIYTKVDLVTPTEIDSDSSQEILILPPTGANRNYTIWIIVGIAALAIIAGGIVLIRKYFKKNK